MLIAVQVRAHYGDIVTADRLRLVITTIDLRVLDKHGARTVIHYLAINLAVAYGELSTPKKVQFAVNNLGNDCQVARPDLTTLARVACESRQQPPQGSGPPGVFGATPQPAFGLPAGVVLVAGLGVLLGAGLGVLLGAGFVLALELG